MKILIAADMEGISGIVHWDQVDPKHKEYDRTRKLMTGDVNAAIRGAYEAGADEVTVSDGHGDARNILIEELDGRARLNAGSPSPLSMVQGIDPGVSAAMFVGYHARAGAQNAILDHTWSSSCVANVRVNGLAVGEIGWNASVCGHFGVPVILISGDRTACAEAAELLGPIETAVVKQASGRMAAECLSPEAAQARIYEAARRAVERLRNGEAPQPLRLERPIRVAIELTHSDMADRVMILPGISRPEGKWVEFHADDAPSAYRTFRAVVALAKGGGPAAMADYPVPLRLDLLPVTAHIEGSGGQERLVIGGCDLAALADRYGTPLYLYDQATLDAAVHAYRRALARAYPGQSGITYAGKAFLCMALAQWAHCRDLWLDCTGAGELAVAAAASVERGSILVHGVNKSQEDLAASVSLVGTIVVDNLLELERLAVLLVERQGMAMPLPDLWLRIRPGLTVATHAYTQTGQEDSKFGMGPEEAVRAVQVCHRHGLPLTGLHFHLGSHFRDPDPIAPALEIALDLVATLRDESGWLPQVLCPGGGWGCAYHEDELPHPPIEGYVEFVADQLVRGCQHRALPLPRLQLEPGRSLVARAGVALYRVGTVKETSQRRWLLLDGGLADNPRPALYGARYSALPVVCPSRPARGLAWLAGPYCESGDVLIEALPFPEVEAGECIAVPMSGAYQLSMASNYNGARKPAVVWLAGGLSRLIQERQEVGDLIRWDLPFSRPDLDMIASAGG